MAAMLHYGKFGKGVHNTASMLGAPVASITNRSKPSATPLAGGMYDKAARKSSKKTTKKSNR